MCRLMSIKSDCLAFCIYSSLENISGRACIRLQQRGHRRVYGNPIARWALKIS